MKVHLIDGTFELFRAYYGAPSSETDEGFEVGAVRGLLRSLLALLGERDVTHVAIAFDHVIESFRNDLYPGYKTGDGIDPKLYAQFGPAEDACRALGIVAWPMVEFECDDALATAAARFAAERAVEQVVICSPDKDLAQCVRGTRVVCLDRMRRTTLDEDGVRAKFGVGPRSIPDWLALVGDSADGFPGVPRWGAKSAVGRARRVRAPRGDPRRRRASGRSRCAARTRSRRACASSATTRCCIRRLATLREDVPLARVARRLALARFERRRASRRRGRRSSTSLCAGARRLSRPREPLGRSAWWWLRRAIPPRRVDASAEASEGFGLRKGGFSEAADVTKRWAATSSVRPRRWLDSAQFVRRKSSDARRCARGRADARTQPHGDG